MRYRVVIEGDLMADDTDDVIQEISTHFQYAANEMARQYREAHPA